MTSQVVVETQQCKAKNCKKMAKLAADYCNDHVEQETGLLLKPSGQKGAGLGLFCGGKSLKKGTRILYKGDALSRDEFYERYPNGLSDYVLQSGGIYYDARSTQSCLSRYICDCRIFKNISGTKYFVGKKETNCSLTSDLMNGFPTVLITKNIKPHEELLTDYGDAYWRLRPGFSLEYPLDLHVSTPRSSKTKKHTNISRKTMKKH